MTLLLPIMLKNSVFIWNFLFAKIKNDKSSKEFYYLGRMRAIKNPQEFLMNGSGLSAVELTYQLDTPVREELYEYITEA